MAKKVAKVVKMELPGGEAKPGPKLASAGVVMPKFCTEFNAKTADRKGQIVPVIITAYEDKTFSMEIKTSPVTGLLLKAAGIEKGSANQKTIVGKVTKAQIREIAEYKLPDLNTDDVEQAMKIIHLSNILVITFKYSEYSLILFFIRKRVNILIYIVSKFYYFVVKLKTFVF